MILGKVLLQLDNAINRTSSKYPHQVFHNIFMYKKQTLELAISQLADWNHNGRMWAAIHKAMFHSVDSLGF